jgi:Domain of unknown function (DUF4824)
MKTWGSLTALAIVVASNAVVFLHIARDRSGEPLQTIELTECEVPLASLPRDRSETALRLQWKHRGFGPSGDPLAYRLDRDKLQQLGFECPLPESSSNDRSQPLPRQLFVVFRYLEAMSQQEAGPAGDRSTAAPSQAALDSLGAARASALAVADLSHLEVADVGLDFAALRHRYPDSRGYPIFRGVVRARIEKRQNPETRQWDVEDWGGRVVLILPELINVPLPHSPVFADLPARKGTEPRYKVTLQFGRNLEPRISSAILLHK